MKRTVSFALLGFLYLCCSAQQKKSQVASGDLDIHSMIRLVPLKARFLNDTSFIWCGTLVKSQTDHKYHLYYSRWSRNLGMNAWVTHSEVAHAISDSPFGPFEFKDIALPVRGREFWDGMVTHNPTVHFFKEIITSTTRAIQGMELP